MTAGTETTPDVLTASSGWEQVATVAARFALVARPGPLRGGATFHGPGVRLTWERAPSGAWRVRVEADGPPPWAAAYSPGTPLDVVAHAVRAAHTPNTTDERTHP